MTEPAGWRLRTVTFSFDHTLIMGVLNVTSDSFSNGGLFLAADAAIRQGRALAEAGAGIIDVGGQSTRPGSEPIDVAQELDRVLPVVKALAEDGLVVSIDTDKAEVARAAIEMGAEAVNDITSLSDPAMGEVVAGTGAGLVLMHMQGTPRTMQIDPQYDDVVAEVRQFLLEKAGQAENLGVDPACLMLDPGIGFGKTLTHNLDLLANLTELTDTAYPVLVGTSRKSFLGTLTGVADPSDRDDVSGVAVALAIERGAKAVRVHNVAVCRRSVLVTEAIVRAER